MAVLPFNGAAIARVPATNTTALLLIDNQLGFRNVDAWGTGTSNPDFEKNITALLKKFRSVAEARPEGERPLIIHVQHKSVWTDSPMHPTHVGPYGTDGEEKRGIDFLPFAAPRLLRDGKYQLVYTFDEPPPPAAGPDSQKAAPARLPRDEIIMTKHGHSVFINTPLEMLLNKRGIKTLLVAGMSTDLSVSTAVRMAHNLALVGRWGGTGNMVDVAESALWTDGAGVYANPEAGPLALEDGQGGDGYSVNMPRIILIGDATRTFGKAGAEAQTVHDVHVESLKEFAEVRATAEVVDAFR
ncbi:Isochorismatase hydrolase [Tolypocladium capitatum]|uniref:Isochorismatase hydrolase n=1 Tax=Tolypocladium capitatum TaxID=45235 RepID=A0A2K3QAQ5_9HYPO|nr:Isochorismatase hydrolase [Tolypocladium capitatum]